LFLDQGCQVQFVDKAIEKLTNLTDNDAAEITQIDLEVGKDWPFKVAAYDAIVVTNYLYRPHVSQMISSLKPGGVFLYETFARGNEQFGRPRNPEFLLKPGELLELVAGKLQVVAYEHGIDGEKVVQRICAVNDVTEQGVLIPCT